MNIGAGEIVLIAILALVLFGPKRLPEIARQVGRAVAEVRKVSKEFEREVRDAIEPLEKEVREAETMAREAYALDEDFSTYKPKAVPPPEPPTAEAPKPPSTDE
jgi:sec-independent protein translocase protein TatB